MQGAANLIQFPPADYNIDVEMVHSFSVKELLKHSLTGQGIINTIMI
uniref:Uncharacterized protein n=1 Tax=Arundo donax TaxID=35708 RepID=A0A0A9FH85_ARUDO